MDNRTTVDKEKRFWLMVVLIITLVGMGSCAVGIRSFFQEDRAPVTRVTAMKSVAATRLEIDANVVSRFDVGWIRRVCCSWIVLDSQSSFIFNPFNQICNFTI